MSFLGEDNFSHEDKQKVGVIICNLGSPDSYSTKDVRKYLREFLSDTRVIEVPKIIWWLVLNLSLFCLLDPENQQPYINQYGLKKARRCWFIQRDF